MSTSSTVSTTKIANTTPEIANTNQIRITPTNLKEFLDQFLYIVFLEEEDPRYKKRFFYYRLECRKKFRFQDKFFTILDSETRRLVNKMLPRYTSTMQWNLYDHYIKYNLTKYVEEIEREKDEYYEIISRFLKRDDQFVSLLEENIRLYEPNILHFELEPTHETC